MVDFEGQKLSEQIFYVLIISFGSVGWVIGYFQQDFTVVFQAWLVGVALSVLVRKDRLLDRFLLCLQGLMIHTLSTDMRTRLAVFQSPPCQMARLGSRPPTVLARDNDQER